MWPGRSKLVLNNKNGFGNGTPPRLEVTADNSGSSATVYSVTIAQPATHLHVFLDMSFPYVPYFSCCA